MGVVQGGYSSDTEILTESGWKHFTSVEDREQIATLNTATGELEYHPVLHKIESEFIAALLHYKARDIDILATPDQNVYFRPKSPGYPWRISPANGIKQQYIKFKKNAKWVGHKIVDVEIGKHIINGDLWCEFLGYFISEGHTSYSQKFRDRSRDGHGCYIEHRYLVGVSQTPGVDRDKIKACLDQLPFSFWGEEGGFVCASRPLFERLVILGKAKDKYVPNEIKQSSREQIMLFMAAMLLGDGSETIDSHGHVKRTYYTSSKGLADDVQELLLKLGYAGDISWIDRIGRVQSGGVTRGIEYRVGIKIYETEPSAAHNPQRVPYTGLVTHVEVANQTIYVRRNGRAAWSGA